MTPGFPGMNTGYVKLYTYFTIITTLIMTKKLTKGFLLVALGARSNLVKMAVHRLKTELLHQIRDVLGNATWQLRK